MGGYIQSVCPDVKSSVNDVVYYGCDGVKKSHCMVYVGFLIHGFKYTYPDPYIPCKEYKVGVE